MTEPFYCTKATPWDHKFAGRVFHDNYLEIERKEGWPGDDHRTYECQNCGHRIYERKRLADC